MSSVNRVFLLGNLGSDPELRYTASGAPVCNFRIATSEVWTDKASGDRNERTEWHRVVVWGKPAENSAEYLRKGRAVHVEGRIQTREWDDKDGLTRHSTEIIADRVTFITRPTIGGAGRAPSSGQAERSPPAGDSDIPF